MRRGDACGQTRVCFDLEEYEASAPLRPRAPARPAPARPAHARGVLSGGGGAGRGQEAAVRVAARYGLRAVYVATDDPEALSLLRERLGARGLRVAAQALAGARHFLARDTHACAALANQGVRTLNVVRPWSHRLGAIAPPTHPERGAPAPVPRASTTRRLTRGCLWGANCSKEGTGCAWIEDKLARASPRDRHDQAAGVVVDVAALARADAFVGTFTSALARLAYLRPRTRARARAAREKVRERRGGSRFT